MNLQTFAICTLGCKVNLYESQVITSDLISNGLIEVDFNQIADVYIINTCSVTNIADVKSRNMIRRAISLNSKAIIVAAGCYSQTKSEEIRNQLQVDIVIGNKYKNQIYSLICEFLLHCQPITKIDNLLLEKEFEKSSYLQSNDKTRAFCKIQDGCNYMCSYCSIPFTRGRQRSALFEDIIIQIENYVSYGYKEIVLTGVNTAGYSDRHHTFYDLLLAINKLQGDFRVRISSVEPFQINDEIISLISLNSGRFCQHWHLCLQSGSDEVLKLMNRKYSTAEFNKLVEKIRGFNPLACISTDIIVGFPSETQIQHEASMQFLQKIEMHFCHLFTYSKRDHTIAATLSDLHGSIKQKRMSSMKKLNDQLYNNYLQRFIGKQLVVIFEKHVNDIYTGKSSEYINVIIKSENPLLMNKLVRVVAKKLINHNLICEII